MPLFKEPKFDAARERDHAEARIAVGRGRRNVDVAPYLVPLGGAIVAILFAAYALTRPSVKDRLWGATAAPPPALLEVELE